MPDILIVEDSALERERLSTLVSQRGFSSCTASSAGEAEALLNREAVRMVILDIELAGRSGLTLFDSIQSLQPTPVVIVLTGNPSVYLKQQLLEQGVADYIVKASEAADDQAMLNTISDLLQGESATIGQGIPLDEFLRRCLPERSHSLFLDSAGNVPVCGECRGSRFLVRFGSRVQVPPVVEGDVCCADCGTALDPEVG